MNKFVFLFAIALCGTRTSSLNIERSNRILGGTAANDGQFPFMVSVQLKSQLTSYTRGHRCGGAMVTLEHAVTSASCLHENGVLINPTNYRVFAGAVALTNDAPDDRHRDIASFTINPNYIPGTPYVNDIAVITLASAFPSTTVTPVPISTTDATHGTTGCTSSGWGSQNNTASASTQLMHFTKTVVDQTTCQGVYTETGAMGNTHINLQNSMICAMAPATAALLAPSSCKGDSGNPLVCGGNLNGILVINGNDCSSELGNVFRPEVYTRVSTFRSWIETTSGAATFQPGMAVLAVIAIVQIITKNVLN